MENIYESSVQTWNLFYFLLLEAVLGKETLIYTATWGISNRYAERKKLDTKIILHNSICVKP